MILIQSYTLICALFLKHFYPIVSAGHFYIALPPLYRIDVGKKVFYALDDEEREKILKDIKKKNIRGEVSVQRFKGLGEMNPSQLRETVMDKNNRRLLKLNVSDLDKTTNIMNMLLCKKMASNRKTWLEQKGDLADV